MSFISAAIFSACCRTSFRSVPTMRTAIGVGEPKLMTLVTMSPGWKPKVAVLACRLRLRLGQSSLLQPLRQPRDHPLGEDLAEPLAELGELDPALLAEGDAQLAVVGPAHEEHHVVDAEVRGDLADEAHRDLRCSRASPRARSPRGTSPPSAGSARSSSRAAAGTGARIAPSRSGGTTRCRSATPAPRGSGHTPRDRPEPPASAGRTNQPTALR